ncbi:hypothetical protein KRP22_002569 [Phytophthora ramorum]|nr:hypothetical protein KRP22_6216 [Phytophthora ramorum]
MGDKLLVWGGALFLVRYELRQLEIQRVDVEAEEKRVSLRVCSVSVDSRVAALPADAHLVVAKEVEDTELAIRYPVLVFQAAETSTGSSSPASRKRRRPMEDTEAITPNARADSTELRPVFEVWCMSEDNMDQYYVLGVRCDNANRSFYMLGFSSNVQNPSLELLLSFNHVGHAYVVDFAHNHTAGVSPSTQALLLNDIPGIDGANICSDGNEGGVHEFLDGGQLVKRSVLITQKPAGHEARLSCHRLRLRDEKKSKNGSHSRKRSRNDEKLTSTGDSTDFKTRSFSYIERTQKASSRGRSMKHPDTHVDDAVAASHAQLGKLAGSFAARLKNGQQKLDRLQMIVNDKIELTRQLNQLIIQLCRKESAGSSKDNYLLTALISIQDVENPRPACLSFTDMETVVSAPSSSIISNVGADENSMSSMAREIRLEQQIMLELFRVVEYVPSSSLVRAEVILNNLSGITLENSYAVLTAPTGESTRGWKCSCSVVPEFRPATSAKENVSGKARFQLEIQFAPSFTFLRVRRGLEAMLWLHWSAHDKEFSSMETQIPQTSLFSLAVASVKFSPDDLVRATNAPTKSEVDCIGGYASSQQEQEQLLFISSGSSLPSWFGNSRQKIFNLASSIVRPTFALVNVDVRERELMSYELSRMVTNLPSDVYVMHNPFQQQHLRALRRVLRGMRQEIQTFQQSNTVAGENGVQPTLRKQTTKTENRSAASMRRAMQHNTDLQVHQLLHALQNRVNFHTMWFDAANVAARE